MGSTVVDSRLQTLLDQLSASSPDERIGLREPILGYGVDCVAPLLALAMSRPDLRPSVASWLEVLARRDTTADRAARSGLRRLVKGEHGDLAKQAIARLGPEARRSAAPDGGRPTG